MAAANPDVVAPNAGAEGAPKEGAVEPNVGVVAPKDVAPNVGAVGAVAGAEKDPKDGACTGVVLSAPISSSPLGCEDAPKVGVADGVAPNDAEPKTEAPEAKDGVAVTAGGADPKAGAAEVPKDGVAPNVGCVAAGSGAELVVELPPNTNMPIPPDASGAVVGVGTGAGAEVRAGVGAGVVDVLAPNTNIPDEGAAVVDAAVEAGTANERLGAADTVEVVVGKLNSGCSCFGAASPLALNENTGADPVVTADEDVVSPLLMGAAAGVGSENRGADDRAGVAAETDCVSGTEAGGVSVVPELPNTNMPEGAEEAGVDSAVVLLTSGSDFAIGRPKSGAAGVVESFVVGSPNRGVEGTAAVLVVVAAVTVLDVVDSAEVEREKDGVLAGSENRGVAEELVVAAALVVVALNENAGAALKLNAGATAKLGFFFAASLSESEPPPSSESSASGANSSVTSTSACSFGCGGSQPGIAGGTAEGFADVVDAGVADTLGTSLDGAVVVSVVAAVELAAGVMVPKGSFPGAIDVVPVVSVVVLSVVVTVVDVAAEVEPDAFQTGNGDVEKGVFTSDSVSGSLNVSAGDATVFTGSVEKPKSGFFGSSAAAGFFACSDGGVPNTGFVDSVDFSFAVLETGAVTSGARVRLADGSDDVVLLVVSAEGAENVPKSNLMSLGGGATEEKSGGGGRSASSSSSSSSGTCTTC